jgi:NAD(P)-dependent dehydrogenase (short-subunit alcohol dehydrogenase family)
MRAHGYTFGHTADGFETQFGTNHFGHLRIHQPHRAAHSKGDGRSISRLRVTASRMIGRSQLPADRVRSVRLYGRSKTANILFAVGFDARHRDRGVRAAAVHPGGIQTELGRHLDATALPAMVEQINNNWRLRAKRRSSLRR